VSTALAMACCAHCGRDLPPPPTDDDPPRAVHDRNGWSIHDVPHGDQLVTVAVCPRCRFGGRVTETHEPGTCGGTYRAEDAWTAVCEQPDCRARWSCWDKTCVTGWQSEHYVDDCDCESCPGGHHDSQLHRPKEPRP